MTWLGKFIGGAFGFLMGGPLGAILGAAVGHQFDTGMIKMQALDDDLQPGDRHRIQMAFFTATFSVMGHIAKADGRVSQAEIDLAKRVMDQMHLSGEMRQTAINLFQEGKSSNFPLDEALEQFRRECHRRTNLLRMFIEIQIQIALADGYLHQDEEHLLLHICTRLGISRFEYEAIKLQLQAQQRFYQRQYHYQAGGQSGAVKSSSQLEDAYAALGLKPSAGDDEVKKVYRRLLSQHHPDKLVSKGLPEEMMTLAKEKTQQITKAYEIIQQARSNKH
ncbi:MAG: co-chaperone DjlA [Gammaproteobacteria bacterium]